MIESNSQNDYLNSINMLIKSKSELKKDEYLKKIKEKKNKRKKNKKSKKDNHDSKFEEEKIKDNEIEDILKEENFEIEYIDEDQASKPKFFDDFKKVFEYFVIPKKSDKRDEDEEDEDEYSEYDRNEDIDGIPLEDSKEDKIEIFSKKRKKLLKRMKISDLKAMTNKPEIVEAWDVTAQDPILLIYLKSLKNTVFVPKHWSQKRKFLQNKRGIIKPPLELPDFIESTGISKIRDNTVNNRKALKQKLRERMQPKLGKMDIDYQVLYDAFFKHQTKPTSLTQHGDIYYENKEYETRMKVYKPGRISEKLRVALGIPENSPPPWIINMQRYGPPPSYPNLKIPGVNAPILDPTAEITPNLWTPPVSEVKAVPVFEYKKKNELEHWGDVREVDEDEYSEMEEDLSISDVDDNERIQVEGIFSGMGMDDTTENNKAIGDIDMSKAIPNPNINININPTGTENNFFTVLEQKTVNIKPNEIYSSTHGYVIEEKKETEKEVKEKETIKKDQIKETKEKQKEKYKFKF